jgi:protein-L-isoaspartate(D-aspartate) O-methyltransferase
MREILSGRSKTMLTWYGVLAVMLYTTSTAFGAPGTGVDPYSAARQAMLEEIAADVRLTSEALNKEALDPRVLDAMATVPRHELVPDELRSMAYENRPLPIGHGQTISQPYIVAIMTDLLKFEPGQRALEIGTGSGYQAAILGELGGEVYTIEIIEELGEQARRSLERLGYSNIEVRIGDGYYGWEEQAPFDAIVVTAAASHVPPPLIKQLKNGGRMIIPVGSRFMVQQLLLVEKDAAGKVTTRQILPVRFVPLTGTH